MVKYCLLFLLLFPITLKGYSPEDIEILSWSPRIFVIRNFLSATECDMLIELGKEELAPSLIIDVDAEIDAGKLDAGRTSMGMFFDKNSANPLLQSLEKRLSLLTLMPPENGEEIQMLHYEKGQQFVPHHDFFDADSIAGKKYIEDGGQRMVTVIMYLNNPLKGGETAFPAAGVVVRPEKGKAVIFYDCLPNGEVDELTLHGGQPVLEGEKWIATKWYRLSRLN